MPTHKSSDYKLSAVKYYVSHSKNQVQTCKIFGCSTRSLIMLKPKKKCNLNNIVSYINSNTFKDNFMFSGRFKIGHRSLSNSFIPNEYL